jgi:hypothetical protein
MSIAETLIPEFDHEMASLRRALARVPEASFAFRPHEKSMTLGTTGAILAQLDRNVATARAAILATPDADFSKPWTLKAGGKPIYTQPRLAVYRSWTMSHMIHHRGQLSVFLRLVGAKVPALYGPSADERGGPE